MIILDDENRKNRRLAESLSAIIEVRTDRLIAWDEVTRLTDYSALGAGFRLKRPVRPGRLLLLTTRMPRELRGYDFAKPEYNVWGLVRRCIKIGSDGEPQYSIGVAFVGKTPPPSYNDAPKTLYELSNDEPIDGFWQVASVATDHKQIAAFIKERKHTRFDIPEEVTLELMDESGWALASETTVTLNLSRSGAAVYSQLPAEVGSIVRVSSALNNVRLISIVRGKHVGQAGLSRINLEFIDQPFPIDLR